MTDEQRHAAVAAVAALLAYAQHAAPDDGEEAADDGPCEP
jgi:hypothetical protein